jgi:DNA mismatch endonuclease (patch repair protein)
MERMPRPAASSAVFQRRMAVQRQRDTAPELALRRLLHCAGLRFRVDRSPLAGVRRRADVVFGPARVVVFVDGCFWHSCPLHGSLPRANREWWAAKLEANRARDADTDQRLAEAGWTVMRVWEHEDPVEATGRIVEAVRASRLHPALVGTDRPGGVSRKGSPSNQLWVAASSSPNLPLHVQTTRALTITPSGRSTPWR